MPETTAKKEEQEPVRTKVCAICHVGYDQKDMKVNPHTGQYECGDGKGHNAQADTKEEKK
jgi:hypothetical protein